MGFLRRQRTAFFHDLHCRSGFGDRITDVWAAVTVARLHTPCARVDLLWDETGKRYSGFVGNYARELFSIPDVRLVRRRPWLAMRHHSRGFNHIDRNDRCIIQMPSGPRQIILRCGREWGNSYPDRLYEELDFYGLDRSLGLKRVVEVYRRAAEDTVPAACVVEGIPDDIGERIGIHARLTDKLQPHHEEEVTFGMSSSTWDSIETRGLKYLEACAARGERFFICSDDLEYRAKLVERLRAMDGDVVCATPPSLYAHLPGYSALVDFFALSRSARIVQMTKYSTFSIAAALVGAIPLVNFYRGEGGVGNRLDRWHSVLPQVIIEVDGEFERASGQL